MKGNEMPLGDTYEMKLKTEMGGQSILNIFHFVQIAGTDNADNLSDSFISIYLPVLRNIMSSDVSFTSLETKNLDDATDFWLVSLPGTGNRAQDWFTIQASWSFTYETTRQDSKSGGKRFSGVAKVDVSRSVPTGTSLVLLGAAEATLESVLQSPAGGWAPVVRGKRAGQLGIFNNDISAVLFIGVYTQNTRKNYTRGLF